MTPADIEGAVRLAERINADGHSVEVMTIARALIAAVGERDKLQTIIDDQHVRLDSAEDSLFHLRAERAGTVSRAERAEADNLRILGALGLVATDDTGRIGYVASADEAVETIKQAQAELNEACERALINQCEACIGLGITGDEHDEDCKECDGTGSKLSKMQSRAERAEAALAAIVDVTPASTVLTERCRCGSGGHPRECPRHPLAHDKHVADMNAEAREVAAERARVVEEIAAWLAGRSDHHDGKLAELPITAGEYERGEHGWASSYANGWAEDIRERWGAKEQG